MLAAHGITYTCFAHHRPPQAYVVLDDQTNEPIPLHDGCLQERPEYKWLEAQINEQHPQPRWARMLNDVDEKGLRFMRQNDDDK